MGRAQVSPRRCSKGLRVHPEDPLRFDFIVDTGDAAMEGEALKKESEKLIKYFLASLTTPEDDLWVNLSPYEKDRVIPEKFGQTEMGRDLLAQDYLLKQLTASLIYPEDDLGKEFWDRVYKKAYELYGTTDIPVNTFNKVWIVPEKAVVYETSDMGVIMESHLKVMLEGDYLALNQNLIKEEIGTDTLGENDVKQLNDVSSQIVRGVILPALEKEVNEGENFALLRQVYHSLILAIWYKQNLQESLLSKVYVNKSKTRGVDVEDKNIRQKIYDQYLEAFRKGVYDYITIAKSSDGDQPIARRYFSGGFDGAETRKTIRVERVDTPPEAWAVNSVIGKSQVVTAGMRPLRGVSAANSVSYSVKIDRSLEGTLGAEESSRYHEIIRRVMAGFQKLTKDYDWGRKPPTINFRLSQGLATLSQGHVYIQNFFGVEGIHSHVSLLRNLDMDSFADGPAHELGHMIREAAYLPGELQEEYLQLMARRKELMSGRYFYRWLMPFPPTVKRFINERCRWDEKAADVRALLILQLAGFDVSKTIGLDARMENILMHEFHQLSSKTQILALEKMNGIDLDSHPSNESRDILRQKTMDSPWFRQQIRSTQESASIETGDVKATIDPAAVMGSDKSAIINSEGEDRFLDKSAEPLPHSRKNDSAEISESFGAAFEQIFWDENPSQPEVRTISSEEVREMEAHFRGSIIGEILPDEKLVAISQENPVFSVGYALLANYKEIMRDIRSLIPDLPSFKLILHDIDISRPSSRLSQRTMSPFLLTSSKDRNDVMASNIFSFRDAQGHIHVPVDILLDHFDQPDIWRSIAAEAIMASLPNVDFNSILTHAQSVMKKSGGFSFSNDDFYHRHPSEVSRMSLLHLAPRFLGAMQSVSGQYPYIKDKMREYLYRKIHRLGGRNAQEFFDEWMPLLFPRRMAEHFEEYYVTGRSDKEFDYSEWWIALNNWVVFENTLCFQALSIPSFDPSIAELSQAIQSQAATHELLIDSLYAGAASVKTPKVVLVQFESLTGVSSDKVNFDLAKKLIANLPRNALVVGWNIDKEKLISLEDRSDLFWMGVTLEITYRETSHDFGNRLRKIISDHEATHVLVILSKNFLNSWQVTRSWDERPNPSRDDKNPFHEMLRENFGNNAKFAMQIQLPNSSVSINEAYLNQKFLAIRGPLPADLMILPVHNYPGEMNVFGHYPDGIFVTTNDGDDPGHGKRRLRSPGPVPDFSVTPSGSFLSPENPLFAYEGDRLRADSLEMFLINAREGPEFGGLFQPADTGQVAGSTSAETRGGIDLNPKNYNIETIGGGIDVPVPDFDPAQLEDMEIEGVVLVIYGIVPGAQMTLLFIGGPQGVSP